MNIKKIFFALIITSLLIGGVCAANVNDFKVDEYNNSYNSDLNSAYVNNNGDSGVSIYKNTNGIYYDYDDDDGHIDYDDDDGRYDYDDDDGHIDYDDDDGRYDYDDDDGPYDYDDDHVARNGSAVHISDDMQLSKNADNTASFTDHDDAEHGIVEVVQVGGEQYTIVFWAKDGSNVNNADLMSKLADFNKDNGVNPVAF